MALRVLEKKLKRVRDLHTDSQPILESLDALATFYMPSENSIETRRNLRADLEAHGLTLVKEFMRHFENVQERVVILKEQIDNIHLECENLLQNLDENSEDRRKFVEMTTDLCEQRDNAEEKARAMELFMQKFHLTKEELDILARGPSEHDEAASLRFFKTLNHVEKIREESHLLLQTQFQSAGLEIFEVMARNQNTAHKILFDWVQRQCSKFDDDSPEPSPILCQALRALQKVEAYHSLSIEEVIRFRQTAVVRKFRTALIHGGPDGRSRPIQMHSHDPVRYVGDILAWVHQAVAFEKDLVESLFVDNEEGENSIESKNLVAETVEKIFTGMKEPLVTQAEQVLASTPGFVALFKISSIFKFYGDTIASAMQREKKELLKTETLLENGLIVTLENLAKRFEQEFFTSVKDHTNKLLVAPPSYPVDLSVAVEVLDVVRRLSELLEAYNENLIETNEDVYEREAGFAPVLDAFINPLIELCKSSASGLGRMDAGIFIINNLFAIQDCMTKYDFTSSYVQRLTMEIGDWIDLLVSEQKKYILSRCSLEAKINILDDETITEVSAQPGMDVASLQECLGKFYQIIFTLEMQEFERLNNPRLRENARNSTARVLAATYEQIYNRISAQSSGYSQDEIEKLLLHHPDQIRKYILDA